MDTTVITELAEYYEKEIGYRVPSRTPFVGKNFNVTRAGIHADGMLKNEEIYNIFDKNSELVSRLKEWVDKEYEEGRVTVLTDDELIAKIDSICKELHIKL